MITFLKKLIFTSFFKQVFIIFLINVIGRLFFLIDQHFSAQLSQQHLVTVSMVANLFFIVQIIIQLFTQPTLVLLSKETDFKRRATTITGSFLVAIVSGILFLILSFAFAEKMLEFFSIPVADDSIYYAKICSFAATTWILNGLFKWSLIGIGRTKFVLVSDVITTTSNFILKVFIFSLPISVSAKFLSLPVVMFCMFAISAVVQFFILKPYLSFQFYSVVQYLRRARHLLLGEALAAILFHSRPILISLILVKNAAPQLVAAFSVANSVFSLFFFSTLSITAAGTIYLASGWSSGQHPAQIFEKIKTIRWVTLVLVGPPILIALIFVPWWLPQFFNISGIENEILVATILLTIIPIAFSIESICLIRISEKPLIFSISNFAVHYLIGLPLIYIGLTNWNSGYLWSIAGLLLPTAFRELLIILYARKVGFKSWH